MKTLINKRTMQKQVLPILLLMPCLILFCTFCFYPFLKTIYLSFFLTKVNGETVKYVGFANFVRVLKSNDFKNSVMVSFKFAALVCIFSVLFGGILALIACEKGRGSRIYEVLFSLPMAVASVPAAAIWMILLSQGSGVVNWLLGLDIGWLTNPNYALYAVAAVTVWLRVGVNFIFLLTGFRNVPGDLLESARIDGANYFQRLFKIVLPMASPQIFFVVFLAIVNSFQTFGQIKVLTAGGPSNSTNVLINSIYMKALVENRFESACVQSLALFLIIFVITRIQFVFEKKVVHYE